MDSILIVEDSKTFASLLSKRMQDAVAAEVELAASMAEAKEVIAGAPERFALALLDVNLPDAPDGQVIEYVTGLGVPSIVFTGEMSDDLRDYLWTKRIADYVRKENFESLDYVAALAKRIASNHTRGVLVVDDSRVSRSHIADLLRIHRFDVIETQDAEEALRVFMDREDIELVLTDYNMPGMDGFELTREIRRRKGKDACAVIGLSAQGGGAVSAWFLKSGANDYLNKPFTSEEFYCRVNQNLDMLEYIKENKYLAEHDFLTGAFSRRYLMQRGKALHLKARRHETPMALAILDVDHFKRLNDAFGHDAGDVALQGIVEALKPLLGPEDIFARMGGEEFCVLTPGVESDAAMARFEAMRQAVEEAPLSPEPDVFRVTVSIGACPVLQTDFETMLKDADTALYEAKTAGRNRLVG